MSLVDTLLENFARERVPVIPGVIADVLCEIFYRCEPPGEFQAYRLDLEMFVKTRLELFIMRASQESRWIT